MSVVGVGAGGAGQPGDRVAMDADEPLGLADAAPLGDVLQDGCGFRRRQVRSEQRGGPMASVIKYPRSKFWVAAFRDADRAIELLVEPSSSCFMQIGAFDMRVDENIGVD